MVHSFPYLESTMCSSLSLDWEIRARISHASHAYEAVRDRVWANRHLKAKTWVKVYAVVVLPSLLYGCQTWTTFARHVHWLEAFHQRCLRRILGIHWWQTQKTMEGLC